MCYLIYRLYKLCDLVAALGSQTQSSMRAGGGGEGGCVDNRVPQLYATKSMSLNDQTTLVFKLSSFELSSFSVTLLYTLTYI